MNRHVSLELQRLARNRIECSGFDWAELEARSEQIIVFGSFALSAATDESDFDLLCIGEGARIRTPKVHVIWISEKRLKCTRWLESELATHVAAYGQWIKGQNTWAYRTAPGEEALRRKQQRIREHTSALLRHWSDLADSFRSRHFQQIRRDLQRYVMMKSGQAPVPKLFLDEAWIKASQSDPWASLASQASELIPELHSLLSLSCDLHKPQTSFRTRRRKSLNAKVLRSD